MLLDILCVFSSLKAYEQDLFQYVFAKCGTNLLDFKRVTRRNFSLLASQGMLGASGTSFVKFWLIPLLGLHFLLREAMTRLPASVPWNSTTSTLLLACYPLSVIACLVQL